MDVDTLIERPVLFTVAVMNNALDYWPVITEIPLRDGELPKPECFRQDASNLERITRIDAQGQSYQATFEEVVHLERSAIWLVAEVELRIHDHYAGRPNPTYESRRAKRPLK